MFEKLGYSNLKIINLSNIDISGGEVDTTWMLEGCQNLETLMLGPWDMSRVGEEYSWHGKATFPKTMYDETAKEYKEGTVIPDSKKVVTYHANIPDDSVFVIGKDSNAFVNNHVSFWPSEDPLEADNGRYLDKKTLKRLIKNQSRINGWYIRAKNLSSGHGSKLGYCYGISATMALLKNGKEKGGITSEELAGVDNKRYYELGIPLKKKEKNSFGNTFGEVIRYYQMSQYLGQGGREAGVSTDNYDDIADVMDEAINIAESGKVGLINAFDEEDHCIIFTKCLETSDKYMLSLFDCNSIEAGLSQDETKLEITDDGHYQTLVIPKDNESDSYIIDDTGKHIEVKKGYVIDPSDIIRLDGSVPSNTTDDTEETTISVDTADNIGCEITLQDGKKVTIESGEITGGRDKISWVSRQVNARMDDSNASTITIDLPQQKYIAVKMMGDESADHAIMMVNDKGVASLSGQNISSAVITPGDGIEINGLDYSFEALTSTKEMISEDFCGMGSVSASTSGKVTVSNPQGNTLDITSDNTLNDVRVYSCGVASKKKEEAYATSSGLRVDLSTDICEYTDWTWNKEHTKGSRQCVDCGQKETIEFIAENKKDDGKPGTKVTVKHNGKVLKSDQYQLNFDKYPGYKGVGTVKYSITYDDDVFWSSFKVYPKGTFIKKLTKGKKAFTVKWAQQRDKTSGYQIQYSLKKNFKKAKAVTVKGNKVTKKTVKKLKKKKLYYVRVRTFAKVSGKTYYSSWSKARKIKTK